MILCGCNITVSYSQAPAEFSELIILYELIYEVLTALSEIEQYNPTSKSGNLKSVEIQSLLLDT